MGITGIVFTIVGANLSIPGIIFWACGKGRMNRINAAGYSLIDNGKVQLNLAVGGNNVGLKLHF
jgi:hypothetical protein